MASITLVQPYSVANAHWSNALSFVNQNPANPQVANYTNEEIPVLLRVKLTITETFTANSQNREMKLTFPQGVSIVGYSGNIVTIPVTTTSSTLLSTSVEFHLNCDNFCHGDSVPVTLETFENGQAFNTVELLTSNGNRFAAWSPNMLRGKIGIFKAGNNTQVSNTPQSVPAGTRVVYKLDLIQDNSCMANNANYEVNLNIPSGTLLNVFRRQVGSYNIIDWEHLGSNSNFTFSSVHKATDIYFEVFYDCNFLGVADDVTATVKTTSSGNCSSSRTINMTQEQPLTITPPPTSVNTANMLEVEKKVTSLPPYLIGDTINYEIRVTNISDYPVRDIVLNDLLPLGLTGIHFKPFHYHFPSNNTVVQVLDTSGNWVTLTNFNANNYPSGTSSFRANLGNAVLLPKLSLSFVLSAKIDTNVQDGQQLTNNATVDYTPIIMDCSIGKEEEGDTSNGNDDATIEVTNEPIIKAVKSVCQKGCFKPGDTIRFYMTVRNEGTAPMPTGTVVTLTDNLPANLNYIGGSAQYFEFNDDTTKIINDICFIDEIPLPPNTPLAFTSNNQNLATSLSWEIDGDQLQPHGSPDFKQLVVVFDCLVNNVPLPNNVGNNNDINLIIPGDITTSKETVAIYKICDYSELQAEKFVSTDGGTTFGTQVVTTAGSTIRYRIKLTNSGTTPLSDIRIVDDLPHIGDIHLSDANTATGSCSPRNSAFNIAVNNPMLGTGQFIPFTGTAAVQNGTIKYFDVERPCLTNVMDYQTLTPVNCCPSTAALAASVLQATQPANTEGFFIDLDGLVLNPGDVWIYEFDALVPQNAQVGTTACNSFLIRAAQDKTNLVLELGESNDACVTIEASPEEDEPCSCKICEDLTVEELHTEITNETRDCESYQLLTTYLGISSSTTFTTIRASVISYDLSANDTDCIKCIKKPFMWASLYGQEIQGINPSVPIGNSLASPYIVPNHPYTNIREVIWKNPNGFDLSSGDKLPIEIYLPPVTKLPCCELYAKICIRLTFINENCQLCEEIICIDASSSEDKKQQKKALAQSKHDDCGCKNKKQHNKHKKQSKISNNDDCGCGGKKSKKSKKSKK